MQPTRARIAIIADIHGNIHALEAVLADIAKQGADRIIVNGDLVNRGPNNVAVMERLWDRGYLFTLGNHDDLVRKWQERHDDLPSIWFDDPFWRGTAITAEALDDRGWMDALGSLPMTQEVAIDGAPRLLVSHGSPRHYREGYAEFTPRKTIQAVADAYDAEIFIGSHTHRPFDLIHGDVRFMNTGAVGAPFNRDPRAQYLILSLRGASWKAEFRRIRYDREAALAAFKTTGFLERGDLSAHIFHQELKFANPLFDPFWRHTRLGEAPHGWDVWRKFTAECPERFQPIRE